MGLYVLCLFIMKGAVRVQEKRAHLDIGPELCVTGDAVECSLNIAVYDCRTQHGTEVDPNKLI